MGIARALSSFMSADVIERMRLAGLLSVDPRRRERKKPGKHKARKSFTWYVLSRLDKFNFFPFDEGLEVVGGAPRFN